tara:strand:- start:128 stop:292 length:165 start_codon:yes stop_codon:yes gene_type:complete
MKLEPIYAFGSLKLNRALEVSKNKLINKVIRNPQKLKKVEKRKKMYQIEASVKI